MDNIWISKYTPKKIVDIIGHEDTIKQIKYWLSNFKNNNVSSSIIISGIHGIGKSITIKLILEEMGFTYFNISSSNIKDNKSVQKNILSSNSSNTKSLVNNKNPALIIDDTENITLTTEKNLLLDLYKNNEKKKMLPIIFLTNEQHSKLISDIKKTCYEIKFTVPSIESVTKFINKVCDNENIKFSSLDNNKIISNIIKFSQNDIRKLIFILQDLKFTFLEEEITLDKIKLFFQSSQKKDKDIGLFDATRELLDNYKTIDKCLNLYETEKVLLPLMIFENYSRNILNRNYEKTEDLYKSMANICNSISIGDVIETNIYTDQNWYLQNLHGFYTCCETTYELSKYPQKTKNYEILFSSDLNKTSIKNINKKNINIVQAIIKKSIPDILILNKLIYELLKNEEYKKISKIFKNYKLTNKYLDTILKIDKTIEKINLNQKVKKLISNEIIII
jgi:DNA polymerase III delta prime subunit